MKYVDLLENKDLIEHFKKIDENNNNVMSHGFNHAFNVVALIEKIGKVLCLDIVLLLVL